MKKIKKKLSYLVKVLMAIGLMFTDLSGFTFVFAQELKSQERDNLANTLQETQDNNSYSEENLITVMSSEEDNKINEQEDIEVSLEENKITIKFTKENLPENVQIKVEESYTYLNSLEKETAELLNCNLNQALIEEFKTGKEVDSIVLKNKEFDGTYMLTINIINGNNEIAEKQYTKEISNKKGIEIISVIEDSKQVTPNNNIYVVNNEINVSYRVLSGGLSENSIYTIFKNEEILEENIKGTDLINKTFTFNKKFDGLNGILFEDQISLIENTGKNIFNEQIKYSHGTKEDNSKQLNDILSILESTLAGKYKFSSEKDILYVYPTTTTQYTTYDLLKIMKEYQDNNPSINYIIKNNGKEILYTEYESKTEEEFFKEYLITNDTTITLTDNNDNSIIFTCVLLGDMNNDGLITLDDIYSLSKEIVLSDSEIGINDFYADVNEDNILNIEDLLKLKYVIKNNNWDDFSLTIKEPSDLKLELNNLANEITTGDEFKIDYVISVTNDTVDLITGNILYDHNILELMNVEINNNWDGFSNNDKFIYYGEKLIGDSKSIEEEMDSESTTNQTTLKQEKSYHILTLTFKAKKAGLSEVKIVTPEVFNECEYYNLENIENPETEVTIEVSKDNTLASLNIAGEEIIIQDGLTEYEITVENDITDPAIQFATKNIASTGEIISAPTELQVGENEITIAITSEDGKTLLYTIKVNRKEVQKVQETPVPVSYSDSTEEKETDLAIEDNETEEIINNEEETSVDENKTSRIIIIILILLVIVGLIYLIFKDDEDEETKKVNKQINKIKKDEDLSITSKKVKEKPQKNINSNPHIKENNSKKNKKER